MESRSQWKYARITPDKARALARLLMGRDLATVYNVFETVPRKSSLFWRKVVDSAVANLKVLREGEDVDFELLYVKEIWADKGPVAKRWIPRAMGRATRINKFTSHLNVIIAER
jgi:large subunit ribosomal protein L22